MTTSPSSPARPEFDAVVSAMLHAAVDGTAAPFALAAQVQSGVAADVASGRPGVSSSVLDGR